MATSRPRAYLPVLVSNVGADLSGRLSEDVGYAVKVEALDLKPYTKYHYRFESCEGPELGVSPVGTFKTLPAEDQDVDKLKLAIFSELRRPRAQWSLLTRVVRL